MPRKELISGEWKKVCSNADCHKAGIPQPIEGFSKDKSKRDGLQYKCKKCAKVCRDRPENKARMKAYCALPEIKAQKAEYYANNREHKLAQQAEHYAKNKESIREKQAVYRSQPENKARKKAYSAQPEIKARKKARMKAYRSQPENKARTNQRKRDRYHSDPVYRLECLISRSIYQALKLRGKTKGGSTFDYLPYSREELKKHLEKQFDEHMTRDNYGTYWHIDHIKPHVMFNYDSLDHPDFQKCWALENLRPLKASENISKGSFWEGKRYYHNEEV